MQCQESKTQVLLDVVSRSVKRVGDGEPPKAIELAEAPPPPEVRLKLFMYPMLPSHCGSFTLMDWDTDLESKTNGYIALCRSFHTAQSDSDSNPNFKLLEWDRNSSLYPSPSPAM